MLAQLASLAGKIPVAGALSLEADLGGTLAAPTAALQLGLQDIGYRPYVKKLGGTIKLDARGGQTHLTVKTRLAGKKAVDAELAAAVPLPRLDAHGRVQMQKIAVNSLPLQLKLDGTGLDLSQLHVAAPALQKLRGQLVLSLTSSGPVMKSKIKAELGIRNAVMDAKQLGELIAALDVTLLPDRVRARISARENKQPLLDVTAATPLPVQALLAGRKVAFNRLPLKVSGKIPRYPLARLQRVDPMLKRTAGALSGRFSVSGSLATPRANGQLQLQRAVFDGVALGDLTAKGSFQRNIVDGTLRFAQRRGGKLTANAKLRLGAGTVNARVKADALDLKVLRPLVPAIKQSGGKLSIGLTARGKLAKPRLHGTLDLSRGEIRLAGLPLLSDLTVKVALSPKEVKLRKLHLSSGGTFDATGRIALVDLKPGKFVLDGRAKALRFTIGGIRDARYNGPLKISGEMGANSLRTSVRLDGSRLRIPHIGGGRDLHPTDPPSDVIFVEDQKAKASGRRGPPTSPLALAASVRTTPLFINSKDADVEVVTDLKIKTDKKGRPRITGRVQLRRGWVRILKRRYWIDSAIVNFTGGAEPNPVLNIALHSGDEFPDVKVFIRLTGTASDPKLDLSSSQPDYDRSQILTLILTGRTTVADNSGAETDRSMAVAGAVAGLMLGGLTDWLAPQVGVDVFNPISLETEKDESGETRITPKTELGKYLTDRLYIGFSRVWGGSAEENQNEGQLEYRITSRWLLMGRFGDAGKGAADLFWIYRY